MPRAEVANGITIGEYNAYNVGVENALRAIKVLLESDEHIVFHVPGYDIIEEFDLDELIEIVEEKEVDELHDVTGNCTGNA